MIGEITNHLWQSTIFAFAVALVALAFRKNRAEVRYLLWLSASAKFLVPFSLLIGIGVRLWDALPAGKITAHLPAPAVSQTMVAITQPFSESFGYVPAAHHETNWIPIAILSLWAFGFFCVALMRTRSWFRIRAAVRASTPINISATIPVRSSATLLEPGVVGFLKPVLLLPEGILKQLTPPQLEAVLAHEQCHIRRRDNLTSAIHMHVEAIFWFHPVVWWIGAKLVEERERACDESVLAHGSEPQVYAEGILNVCKSYLESPLRCVSGVTGSDLKNRIRAILTARVAGDLNFAKKFALAAVGIVALAIPVCVGVFGAPTIRAQSAAAAAPKFDVASVKPCDANSAPPSGRSGGALSSVPGRLTLTCATVKSFIITSYVLSANGQRQGAAALKLLPVEGGPSWINSERYTINAETETNASDSVMRGPMLQAVLEDRFKLKVHRETREVPIYELTVAKNGFKLQPAREGSCTARVPREPGQPPQPQPGPGKPPLCGQGLVKRTGSSWSVDLRSMTLEEFANWLNFGLDRLAFDKTGLTGKFDFHLEFSADETTPGFLAGGNEAGETPEPMYPTMFTAIQQFGLKLVPAKGPGSFLVIDSVERPSPN
jgi:bla regulator protein blaR1